MAWLPWRKRRKEKKKQRALAAQRQQQIAIRAALQDAQNRATIGAAESSTRRLRISRRGRTSDRETVGAA